MVLTETKGQKIFKCINAVFMLALMFVMLYPMLHVVFASVSQPSLLMRHSGLLLKPLGFQTDSYKMVFKNPMILKGYANTLFILFTGVVLNLLLTMMGAYVLSRKNVFWNKYVTVLIVFTMFFQGGIIPRYFTVKDLGLNDTCWALILPVAVNTFNLILLRTGFAAIPDSLEEAAKIDGAGNFTVLFRIIMPLSMNTIAVIVLYYAVQHWNSWFDAMIFLRTREKFPLQLILREILIQGDIETMTSNIGAIDQALASENLKYAVIIVATVPILCIYPFLQRFFAKGVMLGSLKG